MINSIKLDYVGPSPHMLLEFGPRLNLLTGDNGLGKTFALDMAWWALTGTWAGLPASPQREGAVEPNIEYHGSNSPEAFISTFDRPTQLWSLPGGGWRNGALVIYVRIDGGFSVWDSFRMGSKGQCAFHFTQNELWDGLSAKDTVLCNGLLRDWIQWQFQKPDLFRKLETVLAGLSPHPSEQIRPGKPVRVSTVDVREVPTIELPYGTIPVTTASAGMRRIVGLAYLLVWAWSEHMVASELLGQPPLGSLVVLIDEVESHLHPQWQRVLLPAVLDVSKNLYSGIFDGDAQILATTHSPLVLASVESRFDPELDRLITFVTSEGKVEVHPIQWAKQGDAVNWLVSEAFGLKQARSKEAEDAIGAAEAFMRGDMKALPANLHSKEQIHQELQRVLPGHDPFWPRWVVRNERSPR